MAVSRPAHLVDDLVLVIPGREQEIVRRGSQRILFRNDFDVALRQIASLLGGRAVDARAGDGHLRPLEAYRLLTSADTKQLAYSVLTDAQKHRFEENLELDFSFGVKGLSRFRAKRDSEIAPLAVAKSRGITLAELSAWPTSSTVVTGWHLGGAATPLG